MKNLRFIQASDIHLNYRHYNLTERLEDFSRAFVWLGEQVNEMKPDFLLLAGDLFDNPHPSNIVLSEAIKVFDSIQCPILVVPGSHDAAYNDSVGTVLEPLDAGNHIRYLPDAAYETNDVYVYGLRNYRTHEIYNQRVRDDYMAAPPLPKAAKFNIFLFHQAVNFPELKLHPEEVELNPNELPPSFQYYGTGHLHFPKVIKIPKGGTFVQSPSLETCDYSDYDNPKGYYLIETSADGDIQAELIPYKNYREFRIFGEDFTAKPSSYITERATELVKSNDAEGVMLVLQLTGLLPHGVKRSDIDYASIRQSAQKALFLHTVNKLEEADVSIHEDITETVEQHARRYFEEYYKTVFGKSAPKVAAVAEQLRFLYADETLTQKQRAQRASELLQKTFQEIESPK